MIGYLKGYLKHLPHVEEKLVLLSQNECGIAYQIRIPKNAMLNVAPEGTLAELYVYTHVTEDQLALFGFESILQKAVFELLLSISGIGPKLAMQILGMISEEQVLIGICQQNSSMFEGVSGVGKKTAARILLELKDKAQKLWEQYPLFSAQMPAKTPTKTSDLDLPLLQQSPQAAPESDGNRPTKEREKSTQNALTKKEKIMQDWKILMEIRSALENLGFGGKPLDEVIKKIQTRFAASTQLSIEEGIKFGLKLLHPDSASMLTETRRD